VLWAGKFIIDLIEGVGPLWGCYLNDVISHVIGQDTSLKIYRYEISPQSSD
jgi:hypothetical protein